jgi:hypothetical protein
VHIKSLDKSASQYYSKSFLKRCLSNAGDRRQDDIFWDDSEKSDMGASSSENESVTEASLDNLSD